MSTLEKTIDLLNTLPENQIETIYTFVQFLSSQQTKEIPGGAIPDTGKTLKEYREERMRERYEAVN